MRAGARELGVMRRDDDCPSFRRQLPQRRGVPFPGRIVVHGKDAGVVPGLEDRFTDYCGGGNIDAIGQPQMAQHNRTAAQRAMGANAGTASHTNATRHGGMATNMHVVANLNEIVEFDAVFNHCVLQGTTVNTGIGTNFHIVANTH